MRYQVRYKIEGQELSVVIRAKTVAQIMRVLNVLRRQYGHGVVIVEC